MRCLAVTLAVAVGMRAQAPDVVQLAQIRQHMTSNLARLPNYTCTETVERSRRLSSTRKFELLDTLRLEVAVVDHKEMFGWPGAKQFDEMDFQKFASRGAMGNGNFAAHAQTIFGSNTATIKYADADPVDGQPTLRYDFNVPQFLSGYKIRTASSEAIVAYHGSFFVDPKTLDVQRIEVIADELPADLGVRKASDQINYARTQIGESDFLLPAGSVLTMIDSNGNENRNHVRFASCHQFTGESVLSFSDAPTSESAAPAKIEQITVPPDVSFRMALSEEIDIKTAAVGDPVHGRLDRDMTHKGRLLFPKGATLTGRITRIERHSQGSFVGVEFTEIESVGTRAEIAPNFEGLGQQITTPNVLRVIPPAPLRGEAIIPLRGYQTRVGRGTMLYWRT